MSAAKKLKKHPLQVSRPTKNIRKKKFDELLEEINKRYSCALKKLSE